MSRAAVGVAKESLAVLLQSGRLGALGDSELLRRCDGQDAALAFEVLVARHGGMVLRVCKAILGDQGAADDAFQATFIVLWKRAPSLWVRDSVGPWLHGVATRVAGKAKVAAARRARHEARATEGREADHSPETCDDIAALIHEELGRLPEKYRLPVVLCHLQGLTHEDAARSLAWPVGTVRGRLARARDLLRGRLIRRGIAPALATLGASAKLARGEQVSVVLAGRTWKVVSASEGARGATGVVSEAVVALVRQELHTMIAAKLKVGTAVVFAGVLAVGVGALGQTPGKRAEPKNAAKSAESPNSKPSNKPVAKETIKGALDLNLVFEEKTGSKVTSQQVDEIIKEVVVAEMREQTLEETLGVLQKRRQALMKLLAESNYGVPKSLKEAKNGPGEDTEMFQSIMGQISEFDEELVEAATQKLKVKIANKKLAKLIEGTMSKEEIDEILSTVRNQPIEPPQGISISGDDVTIHSRGPGQLTLPLPARHYLAAPPAEGVTPALSPTSDHEATPTAAVPTPLPLKDAVRRLPRHAPVLEKEPTNPTVPQPDRPFDQRGPLQPPVPQRESDDRLVQPTPRQKTRAITDSERLEALERKLDRLFPEHLRPKSDSERLNELEQKIDRLMRDPIGPQ